MRNFIIVLLLFSSSTLISQENTFFREYNTVEKSVRYSGDDDYSFVDINRNTYLFVFNVNNTPDHKFYAGGELITVFKVLTCCEEFETNNGQTASYGTFIDEEGDEVIVVVGEGAVMLFIRNIVFKYYNE